MYNLCSCSYAIRSLLSNLPCQTISRSDPQDSELDHLVNQISAAPDKSEPVVEDAVPSEVSVQLMEAISDVFESEISYNLARCVRSNAETQRVKEILFRHCLSKFFLSACAVYLFYRAFHHLNLLHSALPLYLDCLRRLSNISRVDLDFLRLRYPTLTIPALLTIDAPQIRFCASHNLALIYKARGAAKEAQSASLCSIIWGD